MSTRPPPNGVPLPKPSPPRCQRQAEPEAQVDSPSQGRRLTHIVALGGHAAGPGHESVDIPSRTHHSGGKQGRVLGQ